MSSEPLKPDFSLPENDRRQGERRESERRVNFKVEGADEVVSTDGQAAVSSRARIFRVGLIILALMQGIQGFWALFNPLNFYEQFPSGLAGSLGSFNALLVSDIGHVYVAQVALFVLAALWLNFRLVQAALIAWLVYLIPHVIFYLKDSSNYLTQDNTLPMIGFGVQLAIAIGLLILSTRDKKEESLV